MSAEWSVYRTENKFLLHYDEALQLQKKFDILLNRDNYSKNGAYVVRSLYFDTVNNYDFFTKMAGTENRKKIRIRIYDHKDLFCKLEVKEKLGDAQHKISLQIHREDAEHLINGDFDVLHKYFSHSENAIKIYTMMILGAYRPAALIEYDRLAYIHPINSTRITFDSKIRASESFFNLFDETPLYYPALDHGVILEVKFNNQLLNNISTILKPYNLSKLSISKYCEGRKIFMQYLA